ncbi:MAG: polysaccharide deacetylase family protein [Pseudomonadota bacterium]
MNTIDWTRTLLLWDPEDRDRFGLTASDFESLGMEVLQVSYDRIGSDPALIGEIRDRDPQSIIFTRNDDMPGEPPIGRLLGSLRKGYTSVSAIDRSLQERQTRACLADLLARHGKIELPGPQRVGTRRRRGRGTFSLIFDLEQLGGARFGMPRLLPLLESRGIRAAFFVTGFIAEIYPGLVQRIVDGGHEIGVHGATHEWLQGLSLDRQTQLIQGQVDLLGAFGKVKGANFIFRMDADSPEAIRGSGLSYFVLFRKHVFHRTRYLDASCRPRLLRTPSGDVGFVPVSVETYGMKPYEVEAMLESAWRTCRQEGHRHVSVLMHPFKDGACCRIDATRRLLHRLTGHLNLDPVPLSEVRLPESAPRDSVSIPYRWDEKDAAAGAGSGIPGRVGSWWAPVLYHSCRTEKLEDGLKAAGCPAVLCSHMVGGGKRVCVFPNQSKDGERANRHDPILWAGSAARDVVGRLNGADSVTVGPGKPWQEAVNYLVYHMPRRPSDARTLVSRLWNRISGIWGNRIGSFIL